MNLREDIQRILREERKINSSLHNLLNILFDGFDDVYYDNDDHVTSSKNIDNYDWHEGSSSDSNEEITSPSSKVLTRTAATTSLVNIENMRNAKSKKEVESMTSNELKSRTITTK